MRNEYLFTSQKQAEKELRELREAIKGHTGIVPQSLYERLYELELKLQKMENMR